MDERTVINNIFENTVYAMSLYISYLSSANVDFYNLYWENNIFAFQDFEDADGAISFDKTGKKGFISIRDNAIAFNDIQECLNITEYCIIMNSEQEQRRQLMNDSLEYMKVDLEDLSVTERECPVISSWLWVNGQTLSGNQIDATIVSNSLLNCLFKNTPDEIREYMEEEYELETEQFEFANKVFKQKINGSKTISESDPFWKMCTNPVIVKEALIRFGFSIK